MKIQNFAVVFIVIIMPIALLLSVYTGNLIDVANRQAMYDSILLDSTYDAIRAYQMNTLNDDYQSESNSKVRDINASVNTFFDSLAAGFSSSALTKRELAGYIPAMLYTLYDGYYVYGTYGNAVNTTGELKYRTEKSISDKEYGLKPYVYYSCEYADSSGSYDIIVNYTLDNYITVTGTYTEENGDKAYIARSGYYINTSSSKIKVNSSGAEPAGYDNKIITLYPGSDKEVVIKPEELGEYVTALDTSTKKVNDKYIRENYEVVPANGKGKYYNYVIYNDVKYYLDDDLIKNGEVDASKLIREGQENLSFNSTYDGIPIFYIQNNKRIYISNNAFDEIKSYLGVENDRDIYNKSKYKDVNAYYYYYKSYNFSKDVYNALKKYRLRKHNNNRRRNRNSNKSNSIKLAIWRRRKFSIL